MTMTVAELLVEIRDYLERPPPKRFKHDVPSVLTESLDEPWSSAQLHLAHAQARHVGDTTGEGIMSTLLAMTPTQRKKVRLALVPHGVPSE